MKIDQASRSHIGLVRARNEDSCGTRSDAPGSASGGAGADGATAYFAVADGMGGHPGGNVASSLAISALEQLDPPAPSEQPPSRLRALFHEAARRIEERGRSEPQHREMGTTLTVAALSQGLAWVGHIGDSRLYWIRGNGQLLLTRDHTVAQDLVDGGVLDSQEAEDHPTSHVLTRCLGVCPDQSADFLATPIALEAGDRLLLASDGLIRAVEPSALAPLVGQLGAAAGADRLVEAALQGGAPDNVTVVLVVILDPGPKGAPLPAVSFEAHADLRWVRG